MKNQFKFAFVNLKKSVFTSTLNLIGLTTSFAAFMLIMMYVWNENHFDCYNEHVDEIYRLEIKTPDKPKTSVFMFGPTGKTLADEFPEIEVATTYMPWGKWNEETFSWENGGEQIKSFEDYSYSDRYLTDVFTFTFLSGEKNQPLLQPGSAIVSEDFAKKAWGNAEAVGKQMKTNGNTYTITAVFANLPENSVIKCPIILSFPTTGFIAEAAKGWNVVNYPQFIKVTKGTDSKTLNRKINTQSNVREKYNFFQGGSESARLIARPLRDLHFTTETSETPMFSSNSKIFVSSLFWVGLLILAVALINYMNFATATVPQRIKSISITRIIGSSRLNSISILINETILIFAVSFVIAMAIAGTMNQYFTKPLLGYMLPFYENYNLLIWFGVGSLLLAIVTGLYPAIYSTAGKPVETMKKFTSNSKINFRGVLTVAQFAATIALIAVSTLVIKQVRFMEETDLGFHKDNMVVIRMNGELQNNYIAFENKLKAIPNIGEIARSRAVPGRAQEMQSFTVNGQNCPVWFWAVDDRYIDLMGFQIVEGRNFLKNSQAEEQNMICNETAAKQYGWTLGTKIGNGVLVGIMKDFNLVSLREKVEPFAFWYASPDNYFSTMSIKLDGGNTKQTLASIEKAYNEFSPSVPFRYFFLDDHLNLLYAKENQQVKLITFFSLLSVIVSILGILGLSTFMCQYRIKEIGIRKVNGAKISEMLAMLNSNFVKWVIIAFVIAVPLSWLAINHWLESFVYKTKVSWWIFALAGLLSLCIALITVSFQSWKAATRNPAEALRYE
jgi:putative ABC transport system permease protein